jgi:hypothetical protein
MGPPGGVRQVAFFLLLAALDVSLAEFFSEGFEAEKKEDSK